MSHLLGIPGGSNQPVCVLTFFPHLIFLSFCLALAIAESNIIRCFHAQSCPTLCEPTRFLCPRNFLDKNTGMVCHFLPEIKSSSPVSPALEGRFFTTELPGKLPNMLQMNAKSNIKGPEKESPSIREYIFVVEKSSNIQPHL